MEEVAEGIRELGDGEKYHETVSLGTAFVAMDAQGRPEYSKAYLQVEEPAGRHSGVSSRGNQRREGTEG